MVCGCFPIVSDIDSNKPWIRYDKNRFPIFNLNDSDELVKWILKAINSRDSQKKVNSINSKIIEENANSKAIMGEVEKIYFTLTLS
jgi:glycosyltransferase involved in cell wall biosynthesis